MRETCYCKGCVARGLAPMRSGAPTTCSACGEEVRRGWRDGQEAWWHRESVEHATILGHTMTRRDQEAIEAALDAPRIDANGEPYTTREYDLQRMKKAAREAIEAEDDDFVAAEIPPPEVLTTPVDRKDPRVPGGARTIWNLAEKQGWRVYRSTYSRGPRVHASHGTLLSISDYFILGVALDDANLMAVGSWCDGKFDFAYTATINRKTRTITPERVKSDALKAFIRGE